jgi:anti-sigma factor RsiW
MKIEHPNLLFWYVSGDIDSSDRSGVEGHLAICEECRIEVQALTSMMKSLRFHARVEHIPSAELVLYEERSTLARADRRSAIEAHLQTCRECTDDLESLRQASGIERRSMSSADAIGSESSGAASGVADLRAVGASGSVKAKGPARVSILSGALYAGAALAILIATMLPGRLRPAAVEPITVTPVVFSAPQRGAEAARVLPGLGPWSVRVILPLDAPLGDYEATVLREDRTPLPGFETTAAARDESGVVIVLPPLPAPGRYLLLLRLHSDRSETPEQYPFEVMSPDNRSLTT